MNQAFSKIWIIIILIALITGGIFAWQYGWVGKTPAPTPMSTPEETAGKDESYCEKIEVPEMRANCYVKLAIQKNDASICWKVETVSLASSCWEYFGMKDWKAYRNEEYGYEIKYPIDKLAEASFVCHHPNGKVDQKATKFSDDEMYVYLCRFEGNYESLANDFGANTSVTIDNHEGLKMKTEIRGGGRAWYFLEIESGSTLMIDTFWAYDENQSFEEREQIFNQMLSTFRIIGKSYFDESAF